MNELEISQLFSKSFPFFDKINDIERQTLLRSSQYVRFTRGTCIHDGGECTGVILIKSGSLRVYMISEEGKEITLYRLFPGEISILSASCVLDAITFDVFIDAEEDSECVVVGGCAFEEIARRLPEVKIFTLESALERFSDVMWVIQQMLFMSMDKRLAIFLLEESRLAGSETLSLTHEQIARHLGTAREVVSRVLKHMAADGLVEVSRGGITIKDKTELLRLAQ